MVERLLRSLQYLGSRKRFCKNVAVLAVDYDLTCISSISLDVLPSLISSAPGLDGARKAWALKVYQELAQQYSEEYMCEVPLLLRTSKSVAEFLLKYSEFEVRAFSRANASLFLSGLPRAALLEAELSIRPGCVPVIRAASEILEAPVPVVSLNWSRELILCGLKEVLDCIIVHSSSVETVGDGDSATLTGRIMPNLVTPMDKLRVFSALVADARQRQQRRRCRDNSRSSSNSINSCSSFHSRAHGGDAGGSSGVDGGLFGGGDGCGDGDGDGNDDGNGCGAGSDSASLSIFVGDSLGDLAALLAADLGLVLLPPPDDSAVGPAADGGGCGSAYGSGSSGGGSGGDGGSGGGRGTDSGDGGCDGGGGGGSLCAAARAFGVELVSARELLSHREQSRAAGEVVAPLTSSCCRPTGRHRKHGGQAALVTVASWAEVAELLFGGAEQA